MGKLVSRAWAKWTVGELARRWSDQDEVDGRLDLVQELVAELSGESGLRNFDVKPEQVYAWRESLQVVCAALSSLVAEVDEAKSWSVLCEYEIPRRGTRPDFVILGSGFVISIEMKVGATTYERSDRFQAEDYAKDLEDFHEESYGLTVIPVLCATEARYVDVDLLTTPTTSRVQLVNPSGLAPLLVDVASRLGSGELVNCVAWDQSRYRPTPGIVETALEVFSGHQVREITHAYADNLTATVDELRRLIIGARERSERLICFVTGVPGSGKTLAGMSAVHQTAGGEGLLGTYLSGNGPLVAVLQYALAKDIQEREGIRTDDAKRRSSVLVQMVHGFVKELATSDRPPSENVIVFDEAQRAWDSRQMERKQRISKSEAEVTLEIMGRREDWAVVIALVGEGQEINTGEAGIGEWMTALQRFPSWSVHVSPHIPHGLGDRPAVSEDLHLSVGVRAPRAQALSDWVDALIEGRPSDALRALSRNQDYPVLLCRELDDMRAYLMDQPLDRRVGLLASAQARRLRAFGIEMDGVFQGGVDWPRWFVDGREDIRSSYQLEVAASEFKCQGLEIDWAGLCWGSDFTWSQIDQEWTSRRLRGPKWVTDRDKTMAKNRYRVLLTRARYGLIIWVPRPSRSVPLVDLVALEETADFLLSCGVVPLSDEK